MCLGQFDPRVSLRCVRSPFREHTSLLPLVPWISMRLPTEIGVGMSCMGSQTSTLRTCAAVGMSVVWINEMSEFLNFGGYGTFARLDHDVSHVGMINLATGDCSHFRADRVFKSIFLGRHVYSGVRRKKKVGILRFDKYDIACPSIENPIRPSMIIPAIW